MITYHNAISQNGQVVHIDNVTKDNRNERYFCVGCHSEMTPVLGDVREHHFRHKGKLCSKETYLHQLGKRLLKERFDTQKDFIIKYFGNSYCDKTDKCKILSFDKSINCNYKILINRDLKKEYDTCEMEVNYNGFRADLMLSSKEHPNRNPLFIEISVTHDCEQEKRKSGIQIIEIRIDDEKDLSRPLIEEDNMLLQLGDNNPYEFYESLPHVRFYNFQRRVNWAWPLSRFRVSRDEKGYLKGAVNRNDLNCRNVESNHREDSFFEVAIPSRIVADGQKPDLYSFGMAKAVLAGIPVKDCYFCLNHNSCIRIKQIHNKDIDGATLAHDCNKYLLNKYAISLTLDHYGNLPNWEWKKGED
ncbi:MAG: hypothetical protein J6X62_07130 [Bacteroidales bacterium]|nr:hypothetical protein [Bacteroidales bacterium]